VPLNLVSVLPSRRWQVGKHVRKDPCRALRRASQDSNVTCVNHKPEPRDGKSKFSRHGGASKKAALSLLPSLKTTGTDACSSEREGVYGFRCFRGQKSGSPGLQGRRRHIKKGPVRRIAQPEGLRESMDQLEASLPHFREPTRLLRNALALAHATKQPARVPPMLLLGPPGIGKTYFTHRVAELMGAPHASTVFDQPTAGSGLSGSDSDWANSSTGLLFNLRCMGDCANPVILLDELDKSSSGTNRHEIERWRSSTACSSPRPLAAPSTVRSTSRSMHRRSPTSRPRIRCVD
jgi:ATPase family associated with various cellular activities (AAA)